jgi:hypothetical protein
MGAGTQECANYQQPTAELLNRHMAVRLIAAAWLIEEQPDAVGAEDWRWVSELPVTRPAYEALLALPGDEQRARVAALREAELVCGDRDRLRF